MKYRVFHIPTLFPQGGEAELNAFCASHRVASVDKALIQDGANSYWSFCVGYQEGAEKTPPGNKGRIDYREVLNETDFALFARLRTLRQQMAKQPGRPNQALADFVAPRSGQAVDYVGAFAVTAGIGAAELVARFESAHDDYSAIMVKALADRLVEALAEHLHARVRRELWGYAPDEALGRTQLIAEKYQGIRPAPGYPACPDHTEKATLFELLEAEARAGISLTESFAMLPAASVSGYYFWRPEARYFGVGRIGRDQLQDYARRKGWSVEEAARWLAPNLQD